MTPHDTYESIPGGIGRPATHCRVLTGRLGMSGQCWGRVTWYERRGRALAFCCGHAGLRYAGPPTDGDQP